MERRAARREPPNADYDALFSLTASPLFELDAAGRVLRTNAAAAALVDTSPEALAGEVLDDLLDVDLTDALAADRAVTVAGRTATGRTSLTVRSVRRQLHGADGDRIVVELQPTPTEGEQPHSSRRGDPMHWSAMDDISHNLGTPLSIVAGYAETLASRLDDMDPAAVRTAAAAIHRHASRAVDELRALQARVRLGGGGSGTIQTSVLLAWLRRMLDANLVAANAALVGDLRVDLVVVDVDVARQALLNICTVALQAEPRPRVLELRVTARGDGTEFLLAASDVDLEAQRLPESTDFTIEATRSLVATSGGTYEPPREDDGRHRLLLPTTGIRGGGDQALPTIPVAIIEDDPDTAALIRASLRNSSTIFEVVVDERTFESGLAAVARARPRIVLLDQQLPDRTGTEGIEEVRAMAPGSHVVVLSVRPRPDAAGEDGVLWLEKGRVLADLGAQLIGVLADD